MSTRYQGETPSRTTCRNKTTQQTSTPERAKALKPASSTKAICLDSRCLAFPLALKRQGRKLILLHAAEAGSSSSGQSLLTAFLLR